MITRRKLLAFLGLGGAAAAVASKVEAAPAAVQHLTVLPVRPAQPIEETPFFAEPVYETDNKIHVHSFDMLTNRCSCGAERQYFGTVEHVEYAGPMLEDMPPITLDKIESRIVVSVLRPNGHVLLMDAAHHIPLHEPVGVREDGVCERYYKTREDLQWLGTAVEYDWSPERRFRS